MFTYTELFNNVGKFVSCMVSVFIVFRYFESRYIRVYRSKLPYIAWKAICCLADLFVYSFENPIINVSFWIFITILSSRAFYYSEALNKKKYYAVNMVFILSLAICESIGGILINAGIQIAGIDQSAALLSFVYSIGGSASLVLLYYMVLNQLFLYNQKQRVSVIQYVIYAMITVCVLINIGEIIFLMKHELDKNDYVFLALGVVFMIFLNLYLFYLLDIFAENKDLKYKLALYERQAKIDYKYYEKQMDSHKTALKVLHDVKKHVRVLKELGQNVMVSDMQDYADSFEAMLAPLLMNQYCDNAILNIIIHDKMGYCDNHAITFDVDIHKINLDFIRPIDITTLFGNLLDNAIEACKNAEKKQICLKVSPLNELVYIRLSNSFSEEIKWDKKGRPVSGKGAHHGIGLENVENVLEDYNGHMQFTVEGDFFITEIMVSKH